MKKELAIILCGLAAVVAALWGLSGSLRQAEILKSSPKKASLVAINSTIEKQPPEHHADEDDSSQPLRLCTQNPYISSLSMSLSQIAQQMDAWLDNEQEIETALMRAVADEPGGDDNQHQHTHKRFEAFQEMATCKQACVGGECSSDESKIICGLDLLKQKKDAACVVYSIGGNNWWQFERDLLKHVPHCEIHTFDCTGPKSRFQVPANVNFHHVCLGPKYMPAPTHFDKPLDQLTLNDIVGEIWTLDRMQKNLGHQRIDLLKMDIEGWEWPILKTWPELFDVRSPDHVLPMQIAVEVHYRSPMTQLSQVHGAAFKYPTDMISLQSHLLKMGYATLVNDYNPKCMHCTELTLLRIRCPADQQQKQQQLPSRNKMDDYCSNSRETAETIYHLGWDKPYGRTNNQIVAVLRGLDLLFDDTHVEVTDDNKADDCRAVLAVSGWALTTLEKLFFDGDWSEVAERLVPIVKFDDPLNNKAMKGPRRSVVKLKAEETFRYTNNKTPVHQIEQRRRWVLSRLIKNFSNKNLQTQYLLENHLKQIAEMDSEIKVDADGSVPYMAVHMRWMEGSCVERIQLHNATSNDECFMKPDYIKRILASKGVLGHMPVVVISDMQQEASLNALQNDPEIGRHVIVPALDPETFFPRGQTSSVAIDMVLAAKSAIFAGTRASSMAHIIGLLRVVGGADPSSNYIYVQQREGNNGEDLKVCGDCVFKWN